MADLFADDHDGDPVFISTDTISAVYTDQDGGTVVVVHDVLVHVNMPVRDVLDVLRPGWNND